MRHAETAGSRSPTYEPGPEALLLGDHDPELLSTAFEDEGFADLGSLESAILADRSRSRIASRSPWFLHARASVAAALVRAAADLPRGYAFVVHEAYRPLARQAASWAAALERARAGGLDGAAARRAASAYVAPPELAGHPTGGALDLGLAFEGRELDLGTPFNAEPAETGNATYLAATNISPRQRALRSILAEALSAEGFVNYPSEWWHWSLGDPYWARVAGRPIRYAPVEEESLAAAFRPGPSAPEGSRP